MESFTIWCGFVGAWLLVAGPIYQAAMELSEERIEREHLNATRDKIDPPREASAWWWLLPPVKIYLERRYNKEYQRAFITALPDEDIESFITFINKATGWLFVASGGLLLALKETYELIEHFELNLWVFWVTVVVLSLVAVLNTAARMAHSQKIIDRHTSRHP